MVLFEHGRDVIALESRPRLTERAAPGDRSGNTGMSRRCSSLSAYATLSAQTTETLAIASCRSVSGRSDGGHPR
jgi:hypothetical protein